MFAAHHGYPQVVKRLLGEALFSFTRALSSMLLINFLQSS